MTEKRNNLTIRIFIGTLASAVILLVFMVVKRHSITQTLGWEVSNMTSISIQQVILFLAFQSMSLAIIWAIFHDITYVRFASIVMLLLFIVLVPLYLYMIYTGHDGETALMTAIRQLAFNPSLLMILLPAFYYQRNITGKRSD